MCRTNMRHAGTTAVSLLEEEDEDEEANQSHQSAGKWARMPFSNVPSHSEAGTKATGVVLWNKTLEQKRLRIFFLFDSGSLRDSFGPAGAARLRLL